MRDPDHPIIEEPWTYDVIDLRYHRSLEDRDEEWLDLVLEKEGVVRRLRFTKPRSIKMREGFPDCPGLFILDVSGRGLDGIKVEVGDSEGGGGGIEFWAADVIDLTDQPPVVD